MNLRHRITAFVLPALLLLPCVAVGTSSEIAELDAQLSARRTSIESDRKALNAECGSVPASNASKVAECRRRQADVVRRMDEYKADMKRLVSLKEAAGEEIVRKEQDDYAKRKEAWTREQKRLVEERMKNPNGTALALADALKDGKTSVPFPPRPSIFPPPTGFSTLKPGDVILVAPEDRPWFNSFGDAMTFVGSHATQAGDVATSMTLSPASHSVLFLKEVNGTRLFLDHTPGEGGRVISEKEFFERYGEREMSKAGLAKPLNDEESGKLWNAAADFQKRESEKRGDRTGVIRSTFDSTGYGTLGDDLVCSEADRWVLARTDRKFPDTNSPVKRALGIHYGPANIYADKQNFVVTPLFGPASGKP